MMPRLQQLVCDRLNLQIVWHCASFNGLASEDMIHEARIEAGADGIR